MKGDSLGVISGTRGDYASLLVVRTQGENLVQRASFLEGTGALQIFQLEVNGLAADLRDTGRRRAGR